MIRIGMIIGTCLLGTTLSLYAAMEADHDQTQHRHAPASATDSTAGDEHDPRDPAHHGTAEHAGHAGQTRGTADTAHDKHHHEEHGPAQVHLSAEQAAMLELATERLTPRVLGDFLRAPGEVRANAYATAQVTPRITAQVIRRHARLGEHVKTGQPLVTLSSVEMAEAQGKLVMAEREWQRVRSLGRKVVSEGRYLEAQIARQQAKARVVAYGMTEAQVRDLLRAGADKADGSFVLMAPRNGTVVADPFVLGELVEAGRMLFEITDETLRWVEARMAPEEVARVSPGDPARIRAGDVWIDGKVIQIHHEIDESTRTQAVRIEVADPDHRLHPGVFVEVAMSTGHGAPVLAIPETAVLRSADGDWQVFVVADEPGAYRPVEVTLVRNAGGLAVIDGLAAGTEVVIRGAFFLQAEIAKSGFEVHQH